MADETTVTPGAPTVTAPPVGDNQQATQAPAATVATPAAAPAQTVEELQATLERERKDRQDANKEAQSMRAQLRKLEAAEAERKQASMTEEEKAKAELEALRAEATALKAERQTMISEAAVQSASLKLGIVDPVAATRLLDPGDLKLDADGRPTNTEEVLRKLIEAHPILLGQTASSSTTNPGRGNAAGVGQEDELRRMAYNQGGNIFDFERIKRVAGGK